MKSKDSNQLFIEGLSKDGVVGCLNKVIIVPPGNFESKDEKCWTLMIEQKGGHGFHADIVIAWYKTRTLARQHAKILRAALNPYTLQITK